jgi:flagellar hook-associated protein 2
MANGIDLGLSGLASGFDWKSFISQIAQASRTSETQLYAEQDKINQRNNAFGSIKTQLGILQTRVTALKDPALYESRVAKSTDATIATATVTSGAALGTFAFNIAQRATAARMNGASNAGAALRPDGDMSAITLGNAGFATAATAGTFTVNGKQISVAATDTMQQVFTKISTATGGDVTASYDSGTDKLALTSGSNTPIVLGSATDTSNFLQVARLNNNGTGTISSSSALGAVRLSATLNAANFGTAVTNGGTGDGEFKINGVSIKFDVTKDSVTNVLARINDSSAGVSASYDSVNDRFVLTNKTTGDMGVALEDVKGNFLAATGLSAGAVERGKNLLYTVNGGDQMVSQSNTITESSSGIPGLSVTALKEGTATVTIENDADKIKNAVKEFIDAYNKAQTLIDNQTTSSTDAKGKVTAGILAADPDANEIATRLRSGAFAPATGLDGVLSHLADLGIQTSGDNNNLTLSDETKLTEAITKKLSSLKELFTDETNGIGTRLGKYLEKTIGEDGSLISRQDSLTKQSADIDTQVAEIEKRIAGESERLTTQFIAMESAQANLNQQLSFLQKQLSSL